MKIVPVNRKLVIERSITLLAISLMITGTFFVYRSIQSQTFPKVEAVAPNPQLIESLDLGKPSLLSIPAIDTELDIRTATRDVSTGEWSLDDTHAFHIPESPTPIIYGHNKKGVFDRLSELKGNEVLVITTEDNRKLKFTYSHNRQMTPDNDSILKERNRNMVVLLTCSGRFYELRQALYFRYVGQE